MINMRCLVKEWTGVVLHIYVAHFGPRRLAPALVHDQ